MKSNFDYKRQWGDIAVNTLGVEDRLAKKYNYKPLSQELSDKYRQYFADNIPTFLKVSGDNSTLKTLNGTPICNGYSRIVIGDYGAFIEFDESTKAPNIVVKHGQEYRIFDERYSNHVKYHWLTINDRSEVKIYKQVRRVAYADYIPGKYYVSVHEVML